jgi:hypothetical protein
MSETSEYNFKDAVLEWMRVNEEIAVMQKEVRLKRNRINHLGNFIMQTMKDMDKELCNVGERSLQLKQRKSTTSLKKDDVVRMLRKLTSDDTAAREAEALFNSRTSKFKDYIRLVG